MDAATEFVEASHMVLPAVRVWRCEGYIIGAKEEMSLIEAYAETPGATDARCNAVLKLLRDMKKPEPLVGSHV